MKKKSVKGNVYIHNNNVTVGHTTFVPLPS